MSTNKFIADIQAYSDTRNLSLHRVGVKALKHPVVFEDSDRHGAPFKIPSIATFGLFVDLPADRKGTHMSRFLTLLHEHSTSFSIMGLPHLIDGMLSRLEASQAFLEAQMTFFLEKEAPVSKLKSFLDYDLTLKAQCVNGRIQTGFRCVVPVSTVCPCSKEISEYGAHNQRSHVTLDAWFHQPAMVTPLIMLIERQASCDLFGALKRVDEKFVTEKAYDNPKFVEDLIRDIAVELNQLSLFESYTVSSENFESIHNHSAYAEIVYP